MRLGDTSYDLQKSMIKKSFFNLLDFLSEKKAYSNKIVFAPN